MMKLIIISGRSGSGKSIALQALEDIGYYAIDNLPAMLLVALLDELKHQSPERRHVAVSIDARNLPTALAHLPELIDTLNQRDIDLQLVYLTAETQTLLERYSATRRRHPLTRDTNMTLSEAIENEEHFLGPIRDLADLLIDTTNLSVHELRRRITEQVAQHAAHQMTLSFESFGFKHGVPHDADMVFDVRCLPNPYWDASLRDYSGRDTPVIEFLEAHPQVKEMRDDIVNWLDKWLPAYMSSQRSYFTVAIGCTGGQHRSVYLAEQLAHHFATQFNSVRIRHRELRIHHAVVPFEK